MKSRLPSFLFVTIAATLFSSMVSAGTCPDEHILSEPRDLEKIAGKAVAVETREEIELGGWRDMQPFNLRMRHFTIQPSGRVPVQGHGNRPSILYFISGEATEHNAFCAVPIVHKAGESAAEFGDGVVHWWANDGTEPAVLISVDVIPSK